MPTKAHLYLFSSELYKKWNHKDYIISKDNQFIIQNLRFNFKKLKLLPCDYLLSTIKIDNTKIKELHFEKKFELDNSPYRIYLYKL